MATLESMDEVQGSTVSRSLDGYVATRVATLSGVGGNADEKQYNAINDNEIPNVGDAHPNIPGITLARKSAVALGEGIFRVTMEYTDPNRSGGAGAGSPAQVTIGTTVQEQLVTTDASGEPLVVEYKDNVEITELIQLSATPGDTSVGFRLKERVRRITGQAQVFRPLTTIVFRRRTTNKPLLESMTYVGTTNERDFVVSGDAAQWLCTRIDGTSPDGGQTFDTTYEFVLFEKFNQAWQVPVLFVDPDTGEVPGKDEALQNEGVIIKTKPIAGTLFLEETNGVLPFSPYIDRDFGDLNLVNVGDLI